MSAPYDRIIVLDFETAWSKADYTLSKMTTEEYIRDPRFKAYGACIKEYTDKCPATWYNGTTLRDALTMYDWSRTAVIAHNAQFDVSILEWVYDVHPCFIFDTLSMARALRGVEVGNSLMKLAEDFGLPPKGRAVHSTDGLEGPLPPQIEKELAEYCQHDVFLCEEIFKRLIVGYPSSELRLIDMTLRMYTQPKLVLDEVLLFDAMALEKEKREGLLARLGIDEASLASNPKFAEVLESLGVPAPYKVSKTTGKTALAFAKTDAHFQALLNGDNDEVALLCEARLAVKSTTERTRAQRFLDIAARGTLPVPLSYYGALSGRWTACVVAETEVIVYNSHYGQQTKRIVDVLPDDLVWDGIEFVQHEGVQFSGYKEVISYDGITGTPDHKVFFDDETTYSLYDARAAGSKIMDAKQPDSRAVEAARKRLKRIRW